MLDVSFFDNFCCNNIDDTNDVLSVIISYLVCKTQHRYCYYLVIFHTMKVLIVINDRGCTRNRT